MLGVDNITFWSASPGKFINRKTGENILKDLNIKGFNKKLTFNGTVEQWNETLVDEIRGVFKDAQIPKGAKIEVLCSESVLDLISSSESLNDDVLNVGDFAAQVLVVGINEPRIDVFMNKKFAGAVNILDL